MSDPGLSPGSVVSMAGNDVISARLYSFTSDCLGRARMAAYVRLSPMRSRLP